MRAVEFHWPPDPGFLIQGFFIQGPRRMWEPLEVAKECAASGSGNISRICDVIGGTLHFLYRTSY